MKIKARRERLKRRRRGYEDSIAKMSTQKARGFRKPGSLKR